MPGWYPDPGGRGQRYFDGAEWTEHRADLATLSPQQRVELLDRVLISTHCRVLSRSATMASVTLGSPVNHILHAILTLFMCGLWLPVWALVAATGREKHFTITIDEYGMVQWVNPGGQVVSTAPGR